MSGLAGHLARPLGDGPDRIVFFYGVFYIANQSPWSSFDIPGIFYSFADCKSAYAGSIPARTSRMLMILIAYPGACGKYLTRFLIARQPWPHLLPRLVSAPALAAFRFPPGARSDRRGPDRRPTGAQRVSVRPPRRPRPGHSGHSTKLRAPHDPFRLPHHHASLCPPLDQPAEGSSSSTVVASRLCRASACMSSSITSVSTKCTARASSR